MKSTKHLTQEKEGIYGRITEFLCKEKKRVENGCVLLNLVCLRCIIETSFIDISLFQLVVLNPDVRGQNDHNSFYGGRCFAEFFFLFIYFISWRLITLQYCSGFCNTLT